MKIIDLKVTVDLMLDGPLDAAEVRDRVQLAKLHSRIVRVVGASLKLTRGYGLSIDGVRSHVGHPDLLTVRLTRTKEPPIVTVKTWHESALSDDVESRACAAAWGDVGSDHLYEKAAERLEGLERAAGYFRCVGEVRSEPTTEDAARYPDIDTAGLVGVKITRSYRGGEAL